MKEVVAEGPKQPYVKPTLTKHKLLRDITGAFPSQNGQG